MKIGAILPHTMVFGGVRRYVEIGNVLQSRGHSFTIYTPDGVPPSWIRFKGEMLPIRSLKETGHDLLMTGSPEYLGLLLGTKAAARIFYLQIEGLEEESMIARQEGIDLMVNSSGLRRRIKKRYSIEPLDGIGGVNTSLFIPGDPSADGSGSRPAGGQIRVLCYGRLSRPRKGTRFVINAASDLYRKGHRLELHLFDSRVEGSRDPRIGFDPGVPFRFYYNLSQQQLASAYGDADIFVSAEHRAGWNNTAAEAAACGLPIITTSSGTSDFAVDEESALVVPRRTSRCIRKRMKRLIGDAGLRSRLGINARKKIEEYSWEKVCDRMEDGFQKLLERKAY